MSEERRAGSSEEHGASPLQPEGVEPEGVGPEGVGPAPVGLGAVEPQPPATGEIPPAAPAEAAPARTARRFRQTALWLAALLILVIAGVALSPFWAPALAPLLPWGAKTGPMAADDTALAARVTALEGRPAPAGVDLDPVKTALAALAQRIDRLEAASAANGQDQAMAAANKTGLQQLAQRVTAIEAQAARSAAARGKAEQELGRLGIAAADLGDRLSALDQRVRAQSSANRSGTALLLAVLQMREAVEAGQPFAAVYSAFKGYARDDTALIAGAAPLADAARDGVASGIVLRRGLTDLGAQIAAAKPPATDSTWWQQALDRMRGLVTIRRIGGAADSGPQAAVGAARSALAGGDLAAAISALGPLKGADAEAARPWLRMARERLAAEAALAHLQDLLAARLGAASTPASAAPAPSPATPAPSPAAPPVETPPPSPASPVSRAPS